MERSELAGVYTVNEAVDENGSSNAFSMISHSFEWWLYG